MFLTKEIIEYLVNDPEQFEIVNKTDHAEWFGGLKEERLFSYMDVWADAPGLIFETSKGLFCTSPEGKVFRVNLDVEVGLNGAMEVKLLEPGWFKAVIAAPSAA
jgi:hypothetical protein